MKGRFGAYGGRYVPELLTPVLQELDQAYAVAKKDKQFHREFADLLKNFSGRPTPLVFAKNLTQKLGGAKIYLKNEGLNHTGAHKITHCIGQALIAKRLGKTRLIAETGAGQHGVATATVAAKLGFECVVYMGKKDVDRQRPNVFIMEQLGAQVVAVEFGSMTLKDAVNAAIKDWIQSSHNTHYLLGSVVGPHPYPTMNRDFQSIVGREIKKQVIKSENRLPDVVVACVGGGSNAMGAFTTFIKDQSVNLIGVEAGGRGPKHGDNATRFPLGRVGIVEGYKSYFLQNQQGQLQPTYSISAGLDYPGIGPELSYLHDTGRVTFTSVTDQQTLDALQMLAKTEGILAALESSHAVAHGIQIASQMNPNQVVVINVSGRADKDLFILARALKKNDFYEFLQRELDHYHETK